jgi:hypothetical protein
MKREEFPFFASLFSAKGRSATANPEASVAKEVFATSSAQPHVLQGKMKEKQLTHGETVRASISPVRLESAYGRMAIYFCPMQDLEISATLSPGDGGELPDQVVIEGLTVPHECKPGLYSLKNVTLSSNGTMQVKKTADTIWEPIETILV